MTPRTGILAALLLLGCTPTTQASRQTSKSQGGKGVAGAGTLHDPIMRCGPASSYAYVAREFRCQDGTNPFKGDMAAARLSRSGSQPSPKNKDIIDTYEVPCDGGNVTVYIDMYGCEEQQNSANQGFSERFQKAASSYMAGDLRGAVKVCLGILKEDDANQNDAVECGFLVSAAMALGGDENKANSLLSEMCSGLPPPSAKSAARAEFTAATLGWVARGARQTGLSDEAFSAMIDRFSGSCGVSKEQVREVLKKGAR